MEIPYDVCKRRRRCQILWLKLFFLLVLWFWLFFVLLFLPVWGRTRLLILLAILTDTCGRCTLKTAARWRMRSRESVSVPSELDCLSSSVVTVVVTWKKILSFFLSNFGWSEVKRRAVGCSESRCFSGTRKTRGWVAAVFLRILYEQMISISQIWFSCQCCRTMVDIHKAHMWNQKTLISFDQAGQWNLPCYQTPKNSRSYHIHTLLVQFCLNNEQ